MVHALVQLQEVLSMEKQVLDWILLWVMKSWHYPERGRETLLLQMLQLCLNKLLQVHHRVHRLMVPLNPTMETWITL